VIGARWQRADYYWQRERETKEAAACTARRDEISCACVVAVVPTIHSIPSPILVCPSAASFLLLDTTLHDSFTHDNSDVSLTTYSHARFHPPLLFDFPAYLTVSRRGTAQYSTVSPRASPPLSTTTPINSTVVVVVVVVVVVAERKHHSFLPLSHSRQYETPRRASLNSQR
jgi:hypothetical protein